MNHEQAIAAVNLLIQLARKAPIEFQVHLAAQRAAEGLAKYLESKNETKEAAACLTPTAK